MLIFMKKINKIIDEEINLFLLRESLSSVLYHFTGLKNLVSITTTDTINLSYAMKNNGEDFFNADKYYYLSFTRQRDGRLGYSLGNDVRIEFDGDILNQKYSGKPVNYWGKGGGKNKYMRKIKKNLYNSFNDELMYQEDTENEDRLFSVYPTIQNISKYITRIDILRKGSNYDSFFIWLLNESKFKGITNIYKTNIEFNSLNGNTINDLYLEKESSSSEDFNVSNEKTFDVYESIIDAIVYLSVKNVSKYADFYDYDGRLDSYIEYIFKKYKKFLEDYDLSRIKESVIAMCGRDIVKDVASLRKYINYVENKIIPNLYHSNEKRITKFIINMIRNEG